MTVTAMPCALCFKPADHLHHLTGRDPRRRYLDPLLVDPLCNSHHLLAHEMLRANRIDTPPRRLWTPPEAAAFRLNRLGVHLGLYATFHDQPLWPLLATAARDWATDLTSTHTPKGISP